MLALSVRKPHFRCFLSFCALSRGNLLLEKRDNRLENECNTYSVAKPVDSFGKQIAENRKR